MTRFLNAGRKPLGFSVSIEIDVFFVGVVNIDLISVGGIELDLISVQGSELICFVYGGRKLLCFGIWIETNSDFV